MSLTTSFRCLIRRNILATPKYRFLAFSEKASSANNPQKAGESTPPPKPPEKMPSALVVFTNGSEDMETVVTVDILRRAGIEVTLADITGADVVTMSNNVKIVPDSNLCSAKNKTYDVIVLPGGMDGTKAMIDSSELGDLLREQEKSNKFIAAICAAPTALKAHRIGLGKKITAYPSVKDELKSEYCFAEDNVVIDGKLITSQGPGTAYQFGLHIASKLAGKEKAEEVAKGILVAMECVPEL